MKKAKQLLIFAAIILSLFMQKTFAQQGDMIKEEVKQAQQEIFIKGLYDNYSCGENFKAHHGFSCLIEIGNKSCLFDAGKSDEILLKNCAQMKVDFAKINTAIISHLHGDHMGGMPAAIKLMNKPVVYTPSVIQSNMKPENYKFVSDQLEIINEAAGKVVYVSEPYKITEQLESTGVIESRCQEQSLIIDTDKGIVIITGCAHAGPVEIVKKAKELNNKPVRLLLGGFHLADKTNDEILTIINELKDLGVQKCSATHCTGDAAIALFKESFKENYVDMGAGKILRIDSDF